MSYNIPLFSRGRDYCLTKMHGGVSAIVYCSRYVAIWCLSHVYSWGAPFTPTPQSRRQTIHGGKTRLLGHTPTRASPKTSSHPPLESPFPTPTRSLNLHHNKDKEGGGARGLRLRGVKTGGAMGPGRVMISPLAREKSPSEQITQNWSNNCVCRDCQSSGEVGGGDICMWLHASGCRPFTYVYNKQMTPISYFWAAGQRVYVWVCECVCVWGWRGGPWGLSMNNKANVQTNKVELFLFSCSAWMVSQFSCSFIDLCL